MKIWKHLSIRKTGGALNLNFIPQYYFKPSSIDFQKDYYKVLSVREGASLNDIKSAFYKLAKMYHPDVNKGKEDQFKEINEAYEVLGDQAQKQQYDSMRKAGAGFPFESSSSNNNTRAQSTSKPKNENFYYYWEDTNTGNQNNPFQNQRYNYSSSNSSDSRNQSKKDYSQQFMSETLQKMFRESMQRSKMGKKMGTNQGGSKGYYDSTQSGPGYNPYQRGSYSEQNDPRWANVNNQAREFYQKQMQDKIQEQFRQQMEYEQWKKQRQAQVLQQVEEKVINLQKQVSNVTEQVQDGINLASQIISHAWTKFTKK